MSERIFPTGFAYKIEITYFMESTSNARALYVNGIICET